MILKAVIIDDMPQAIVSLREDLATYCPEIEVVGTGEGVVSGAKIIRQEAPDIVFLDIQMQDGTGFDLLEVMGDIKARVIFTTASDAYAIRAFRFSAVDYLLKPIDPDELQAAVKKVVENQQGGQQEQVDLLLAQLKRKDGEKAERIALHTTEKIYVVWIKDIIRCEAASNYTVFHMKDKRQLLVTRTLKDFDKMLTEHKFFRPHQSHLVNSAYIKEFVKADGGWLVMTDGAELPVSTRKRMEVVQIINAL